MKTSTRRGARRAQARAKVAPVTSSSAATDDAAVQAPARPDLRPPMRDDDPRSRAAQRAAELRGHLGSIDEGEDKFFVDPADIPDGWDYEWKRRTVYGAEDPAYQVAIARRGWEPVPASRHPSMMPSGYTGQTIERDGMVLMERPKEISDEARAHELRKARRQVRAKEEQLTAAPAGQFERENKDRMGVERGGLMKLNKSYERVQVPEG